MILGGSRAERRLFWQTPDRAITSGLPTIQPQLLSPLQVDERDYLPVDPSLVAMSTLQGLAIRLITAVDETAKRAGQEPKYAAGSD